MARYTYIDSNEDDNNDPFATQDDNKQNEFEELLKEDKHTPSARRYHFGDTVKGIILSVSSGFIFVDLGGKNAGTIAVEEFASHGESAPRVGEQLHAFVRSDNGSEIILTRSLSKSDSDDLLIRNAFENNLPVEAKIESVNKGGFTAVIGNKRCFVPMGHMDIVHFDNPDVYIGSLLRFHIQELEGKNIVLSRKTLLKQEKESLAAQALVLLAEGQTKKATVSRIMKFGAFATFDALEGLIPINELSWSHIKKIEDVVRVGEELYVKVIKIERTPKLKITLSLKTAQEPVEKFAQGKENVTQKETRDSAPDSNGILATAFQKAKKR